MAKQALFFFLALLGVSPALAQNTGGVFSPVVNEGHRSIQYRAVLDPDNSAGEAGFAQRLHYQESVTDDLMWRVLGQTRKTRESDFDFDFVQAELFWDLGETGQSRRTGFRFDLKVRDGDRSEQFGANWINQFSFDEGWSARAIVLTSMQFGDNAADGVGLGSRFRLSKALEGSHSFGVDMFNSYGSTSQIGSFNSQSHTIGPFLFFAYFQLWLEPFCRSAFWYF